MPYVNGKWVEDRYDYGSSKDGWIALAIVVGAPSTIVLIYKAIQYYNELTLTYPPHQIWGTIVAVIIFGSVIGIAVTAVLVQIWSWYNCLWKYDPLPKNTTIASNTSYVAPKKPIVYVWGRNADTPSAPAGLIEGERTRPPSAAFFGRINGEVRTSTGDYEEKYLTYHELAYWDKQKALNPALRVVSKDEILDNSLEGIETTTKISKW